MYFSVMVDWNNLDSSSNGLCMGRVKLCEAPQFHKGVDAQVCLFLFLDMSKIIILYIEKKKLYSINTYVVSYKSTSM